MLLAKVVLQKAVGLPVDAEDLFDRFRYLQLLLENRLVLLGLLFQLPMNSQPVAEHLCLVITVDADGGADIVHRGNLFR